MTARRSMLSDEPRSILVVLPTWVGDFVMATPALRAIRERFAEARIAFLTHPNLRDLVRGGDWMDELIEDAGRGLGAVRMVTSRGFRGLVRDLRGRRFDLAVLLPNSFRAAVTAWLAGARRSVGYDRDGRGMLLTDRVPVRNLRGAVERAKRSRRSDGSSKFEVRSSNGRSSGGGAGAAVIVGSNLPVKASRYVPLPLVEYYADLVEAIGGVRPGDRLELFTTPDCDESVEERLASLEVAHNRPLVVLSPGAKYGAAKCWMPERFAAVADRLIETEEAAVLVTCGPGEEAIARTIGSQMKKGGFVLDNPRLSLGELKSLIRRADLLICNDAGPRHFAKAFGTAVVTVFGPTHPDWTATSYEAERIVRINVDCGPCQQRTCPLGHLNCMTGVTPEMVYGAAVELLHGRVEQGVR